MPLALLLSPDDQAVTAITSVLEEMSVTCERPLDGVSAAKKLNSHNFDLVLVDCENLPAAKLIFDVCRRGNAGHNPVAIAIVDGRAGLPTAFRLGAELILTKPVAKDQARSTVRTAVGRVKKEEPARLTQPVESSPAPDWPGDATTANEEPAEALLTHYESSSGPADQAPVEARAMAAAVPSQPPALSLSVPMSGSSETVTTMSAAASVAPEIKATFAPETAPILTEPKPEVAGQLSDDPVLAELERTELERTESEPAAAPPAPVFSSYAKPQDEKKRRGPLLAVLAVAIVCGGLYAAWVTQPAFRIIAEPQIDRVLALAGMASTSTSSVPAPAKPTTQPVPAPLSVSPSDAAASQPSPAVTASNSASTPPAATSSLVPASSSLPVSTVVAAPASPATPPGKTEVDKVDSGKPSIAQNGVSSKAAESHIGAGAAPADVAQSSDQTIVLSSKGAEKRLLHSVQPTYPATARTAGAEGTIVLKALIDENGKVADAKLVEGNAALAESAISAVRQWKYRPYLRDGKAVPFQTIVLIDFQRP